MTDPLLDRVEIVGIGERDRDGDDTAFVAAHGAGETGWYGPVSDAVARAVGVLSAGAVGIAVTDHQHLPRRLRRAADSLAADVAGWAVGALDCALWDLHGRLAEQPVAALLAPSRSPSAVPAYASWLRLDLRGPEAPGALARVAEQGWALTKWGLRRHPGPSTEAEAGALAEAVARTAGSIGGRFAVDAVGTWSPALAAAFADAVDPSALVWLEDPLPAHDLDVYRHLSDAGIPVACGERLRLDEDPHPLLRQVRPAALTIDVVGCGGLTRAVDITSAARLAGVPVYPHGRSLVPGLHLAAAFPDAVPAVEFRLQWEPRRQRLYAEPRTPRQGLIPAPEQAGLGTRPRRTQ